jgi:hypothetical protein
MGTRLAFASLAMVLGLHAGRAQAEINVLPGGSTVEGKTIGDWTTDWWKWALGIPAPGDPLGDTTGADAQTNQSGPVFFLAGAIGDSPPVTRTFNVPADKYLLFPLINWVGYGGADPGYTSVKQEIIAITTGTIDPAKLVATINGTPIADLASHRESFSGDEFALPLVANNSFGHPAATYPDAYADGYWIMLAPLGSGSHTLRYGGMSVPFDGAQGLHIDSFMVDVTANITAIPEPSAAMLSVAGVLFGLVLVGAKLRVTRRVSVGGDGG